MTKFITKTFVFGDELNSLNKNECIVKIDIEQEVSDNREIYNIAFKYKYRNEIGEEKKAEEIKAPHPFAYVDNELVELKDGFIIHKNQMTKMMIKNLFKDDEKLKKYIGNSTPQNYRKNIIVSLAYFWD